MISRWIVLSDETQYARFASDFGGTPDLRVFCDNARYQNQLAAHGVAFEPIDEFLLKERWDEINGWGCTATAEWIRLGKERGLFRSIDAASVIALFFSHLLVHMLKNFHLAQICIQSGGSGSPVVFRGAAPRVYPKFSGNAYLNAFIAELAAEKGLSCAAIDLGESAPPADFYFKKRSWWKTACKRALGSLYASAVRFEKGIEVLACGSLRHLEPVILELRARGTRIALYESEFRMEAFRFARRQGIPYFLPSCFERVADEGARFDEEGMRELRAAFEIAASEGLFCYQGRNFAPFIRTHILPSIAPFFKTLEVRRAEYTSVFAPGGPKAILTEEDYGLNGGFLAAFARSKGVRVFCFSHANVPYDFTVPEKSRVFRQSDTFVYSQYEKDLYAARGWDPEGIHVSGTPRYDALIRLPRVCAAPGPRRLKLLYCANTFLTPHSPEDFGYLGVSVMSFGGVAQEAAVALFEAIRGLPIDVILKPHHPGGLGQWRAFLDEIKSTNPVTLVTKAHESIFSYLRECDAMVLSYWSTTMIEAAICDLPTIFMDLRRNDSPKIRDFAAKGFCRIARDASELRREMERLRPFEETPKRAFFAEDEYTLGKKDGLDAVRAVDWILGALRRSPADRFVPRPGEEACVQKS